MYTIPRKSTDGLLQIENLWEQFNELRTLKGVRMSSVHEKKEKVCYFKIIPRWIFTTKRPLKGPATIDLWKIFHRLQASRTYIMQRRPMRNFLLSKDLRKVFFHE